MTEEFVNNSGQGPQAAVPAEVLTGGFNWGAFFLHWIWGLGNKTYLTLVMFATLLVCWIPVVGALAPLGLCIWFGMKGNEWAWQNKQWESVEQFHSVQKTWAAWGLGLFIASFVLGIVCGILFGAAVVMSGAAQ